MTTDIGRADRIRQALRSGPMTLAQLEARLQLPRPALQVALQYLCNVTGGVVAYGKPKHYRLYVRREIETRTREWKPLKRNPFELMELAMVTRR